MNWTIGIDMYTLMCIKLMTNKNVLYKKEKINFRTICYLDDQQPVFAWDCSSLITESYEFQ